MSTWRLIFLWSAALVLMFILLGYAATDTSPYEICKTGEHTGYKECTTHELAIFALIKVAQFLDAWAPLIAALAAGVTGYFTATIWKTIAANWLMRGA